MKLSLKLVILLLTINSVIKAQKFEFLIPQIPYNSLFIVLIDTTNKAAFKDIVQRENIQTKGGLLLVTIDSSDKMTQVKDSLNYYLNDRDLKINKKQLNLIIVGNDTFFYRSNTFNNQIFASKTYIPISTTKVQNSNFNIQLFGDVKWQEFFDSLSTNRIWDVELLKIQEGSRRVVSENNRKEIGFGVTLGGNAIFTDVDFYTSTSMTTYGLHFYRNLEKNWFLHADLLCSVNFPNPQSQIQEQVRSQVDISTLQNGGMVEIDLNIELAGHIYGYGAMEVRHRWNPNQKFQPFVGVGFSLSILNAFSTSIDTSLTIDGSNLQGGGGLGQGGFERGEGGFQQNGNMNRNNFIGFGVPISAGFQYRLAPSFVFHLNGHYSQNFIGLENTFHNLGIQAGLSISLMGKRRTVHDYISMPRP